MKILAIMCLRNEADVLGESLAYLVDNGIDVYVMDNASTDGSLEIAQSFLGRGVVKIEKFPSESGFPASAEHEYRWEWILQRKEQLARILDYDWFLHVDADEFRDSPWEGMNLAQAIEHVDSQGYNAINFDVFDFQWTDADPVQELSCQQRMKFFWQRPWWLSAQVKAWKSCPSPLGLSDSGGHFVEFPGRRIYPQRFILRHYPMRSQAQMERKAIADRADRLVQEEVNRGWHKHLQFYVENCKPRNSKEFKRIEDPVADMRQLVQQAFMSQEQLFHLLGLNPAQLTFGMQRMQIYLSQQGLQRGQLEIQQDYQCFINALMGKSTLLPGQIPNLVLTTFISSMMAMASQYQEIDLALSVQRLQQSLKI